MNLLEFKELIDGKPMHIATVNKENNPNLSVASDVRVIEKNKIIIPVNEMVNTQINIQYNPNVVLTVFNEKYEDYVFGAKLNFIQKENIINFVKKHFLEMEKFRHLEQLNLRERLLLQ